MMTPDDARRLIKNRNDRQYRAMARYEAVQEEQLDYLESQLAIYMESTDFVECTTAVIDEALTYAINNRTKLIVGFENSGRGIDDGVYQMAENNYYHSKNNCTIALFNTAQAGLDGDVDSVAQMLCETVRALYEDAGWSVSEPPQRTSLYYLDGNGVFMYSFEIYYE